MEEHENEIYIPIDGDGRGQESPPVKNLISGGLYVCFNAFWIAFWGQNFSRFGQEFQHV